MNNPHLHACIRALFAGAAALTLGLPAHADVIPYGSDERNDYDSINGNAVAYVIDIKGDVRNIVPEQLLWKVINPWAWWADANPDGCTVNATTIEYDPDADVTRIKQSGTPALPPVPATYKYSYPDGNGNRTYHTGINMGNPNNPSVQVASFEIVSRHWVYDGGGTQELDAVTLSWSGTLTKKTKTTAFLTTYIRTKDPQTGVARSGFWADTLYDPTKTKPFTITNNSDRPFVIDTLGYISNRPVPHDPECLEDSGCHTNWVELGDLSAELFPPPGDPGSRFIRVKHPKTAIPPGGSFSFKAR